VHVSRACSAWLEKEPLCALGGSWLGGGKKTGLLPTQVLPARVRKQSAALKRGRRGCAVLGKSESSERCWVGAGAAHSSGGEQEQ